MLPLGTSAPDFDLPGTEGERAKLADYQGKPVLVMFICNHCPYVKHVAAALAQLGRDYAGKLGIVAINSNDTVSHPDDSPEKMKAEKKQRGYTFPYLLDETQKVARAYNAACTPDFFLFDSAHKLTYRGQMDGARPGNDVKNDGRDLRFAMDAVLAGKAVNTDQKPSMGCNIKWK
jgi:peroxiredoxin